MNPGRSFSAVILLSLSSLSACAGVPNLGTMASQMAGGSEPDVAGETLALQPDNNITLPDGYRFSYRVAMRITNNQGTVEPVFYMQPDAPYHARTQSRNGFTGFLVYDNQNNVVVLFAEMDGEKRRIHNRMNLETRATLIGGHRDAPEKEPVKSLGNKTILGYPTRGYEISTLAGTTQLWVTDQAPATLFSPMFGHRTSEFGDSSLSEDTMIMEASFTSAFGPEKNYHMEVTQIQPDTVLLSTGEYTGEL